MAQNYLIGLGGSGGKVISKLYARIIEEHGMSFASGVECIAIDTDQEELDKLSQLGVKKVCISGAETVGQLVNRLGDDVTDWCPDTANEGNFYSSPVFNGASQCRLKSRLCFSNFLKNKNNSLSLLLEESRKVSPHGESTVDAPPTIFIISSIAGGTGSGIFIQVAFYIKKFFETQYGLNVKIHGLFACPELYKNVVNSQQLPSLYANAYAVVRELNAFNLICGGKDTSIYDRDIDIEISTSCEGRLFEKNAEGRYGDKPYDIMYFIDKKNYLSRTLGGLENYYDAMADIAYSHLYTDISEKVLSTESNEMHSHSMVPSAIYGSAGASTLRYPYEDILEYFASRSIKETVSNLWANLDRKWYEYLEVKDAAAVASGRSKYMPKPNERAETYIRDFEAATKSSGVAETEMAFLLPMVEEEGVCYSEQLLDSIIEAARATVKGDERIRAAKDSCEILNVSETLGTLCANIDDFSLSDQDDSDIFSIISSIDNNLETYCKKSLEYVADNSIEFAHNILCDNSDLWDNYDRGNSSINVANSLLFNQELNEWVHPVAARYLLYKFSLSVKEKLHDIISTFDTPDEDIDDFYNYLIESYVAPQKNVLSPNDEELYPNAQILQGMISKPFKKRKTKKYVNAYFDNLSTQVEEIDNILADALVYFALSKVSARLSNLIEVYESFFDNIDDYIDKAETATSSNENKHDKSVGDVYVCASAEIKEYLYSEYGKNLNAENGETASLINKALFYSMRTKAAEKANAGKSLKIKKPGSKKSAPDLFDSTVSILVESAKNDVEIKEQLDLNIFDALMLEYKLMNADSAEDVNNYSESAKHPEAKQKIDAFVATKFASLIRSSAPCLLFDLEDTYNAMFKIKNQDDTETTKPKVSNSYRYLAHNSEVSKCICQVVSGDKDDENKLHDFYTTLSADLPKDTESQSVSLTCVTSEKVDKYSILCYSTVHCLQPYQIRAFDELKGGEFYEHYSNRILEMQRIQKYSLTPHLDKRWHKHSMMPYINITKEEEHRLSLAKAFLYALCFGKIGYYLEGSYAQLVFEDRTIKKPAEAMFYDGQPIPYHKINRAMSWLANHEDLVERYSHMFDKAIQEETVKLTKYSENIGKYKTGITNYGKILNQMKRNIIRAIELRPSGNGREKILKTKESISVLELAWLLHNSEETEVDKDYGELLVKTLCNAIKEYAKAPYNARQIKEQNVESESYKNYMEVADHIAEAFLETFATSDSVTKKKSTKAGKSKKAAPAKKKKAFGVDESDISDTESTVNAKTSDGSFEWAEAEIRRYISKNI